ncbi:hypothetical protein [Sphingobacterium hungaricum]|uniref:Uncharacterized protein n=1 Tax=Sphingobacterium hungaricum TaxID=2082723 RepID=A0A928UY91_9SPHI|nr:hypothetical protein [Sphingobacterium hungaricum]MBE8715450.1 hypothetical protein [Sphingobacterium hungaricum]
MKFKSIIGLLLLLFICACNQTKQNASVQFYSEASSDENQQLESLIKEFYKWTEFESSGIDFETLENLEDSTYDRLDMVAHQKRLDELRSSNFFSEGFLAHYDSLAMRIDQGLKDKSLVYPIGELPP